MDTLGLGEALRVLADEVDGPPGRWLFTADGIHGACFADNDHGRMRLIAPILETTELSDDERRAMLEANYHTALDARYATSDGIVYAVFLHPLASLDDEGLASALRQIINLVYNFGSTWASTSLVFGAGAANH